MSKIIYSILIAALSAILLGPLIIPVLKILRLGQNVRDDGPKSHLKKSGTPTMGGILILISMVTAALLVNKGFSGAYAVAIISALGNGLIGLIDDVIMIIKKRSLGLRAYQKIIGQVIFSFMLSAYAYINIGSKLYIPFTRSKIDLGLYYIPLVMLFVIYITNCVNLTDGLDGLSSSITLYVCIFFTFVCYGLNMDELAIFSAGIVGACLGFLRYNSHPAQIIMGNTGSFALGGAVSAIAVLTGFVLYLPIVGIVFVIEGLSVMLQVGCFKITGKKIFKMAPLHHHFELSGWHETKITTVFGIVTTIFCLVGFLATQQL